MTGPVPILCHGLAACGAHVVHGFFTRAGGVSQGIHAGLNVGLGSTDSRESVLENRRRVSSWMGANTAFLATLNQIHSSDVLVVEEDWADDARPRADAMVTRRPNIALGVLTADCGPILFADPAAGVIGAAHAGWKGATGGIVENTVAAMERLGARRGDIVATLGPTITRQNYEVGPEFVARLIEADAQNRTFLHPSRNDGHAMFDLPAYIVDRLSAAGVEHRFTGHCTYADEARFYSYRRTTHRQEPDYGRQISAILLRD